jgi:hypothetical protein
VAKLTSPRVDIHADPSWVLVLLPRAKQVGGRVKREINNKEGFLMQVFKRWNDTNMILFLSQCS